MSNENKKLLLKTEEAAEILSLSKSTLDKLRCRGDGPRYTKYRRSVRYRYEDLLIWSNKLTSYESTSDNDNSMS
jgi:predicted DNA-binding transcriptional regulator AlpA